MVVYTVVGGSLGIRDPTPTPWCLEAQVMTNDALHRSASCDAVVEGWYAEAEFHGGDLIGIQFRKITPQTVSQTLSIDNWELVHSTAS